MSSHGGLYPPGTLSQNACLSHISIAVIRHQDQGNLEKKEYIWGLQLPTVRVHDRHGWEQDINHGTGAVIESLQM